MWQKMLQIGSGGGSAESPTLIFKRFVLTPSASKKTIGTVDGKIRYVVAVFNYYSSASTGNEPMRYLYDAEKNTRYRWFSRDDAYTWMGDDNTSNQTFFTSEDGKTVQVSAQSTAYQRSTEYFVIYESGE